MNTIHFSIDFPEGAMKLTGSRFQLTRWTAVGVQGSATFRTVEAIPAGSLLTLTEIIPDTFASVSPLRGTGSVAKFTSQYTLTITPPTEPHE